MPSLTTPSLASVRYHHAVARKLTRVFLHAKHAAKKGFKTVMNSANDTDVLVIAVATLSQLQELGLQELWLVFG